MKIIQPKLREPQARRGTGGGVVLDHGQHGYKNRAAGRSVKPNRRPTDINCVCDEHCAAMNVSSRCSTPGGLAQVRLTPSISRGEGNSGASVPSSISRSTAWQPTRWNIGQSKAVSVGLNKSKRRRTWTRIGSRAPPRMSAAKAKETVGKVTGDKKTETEGKADQAEGKAQNAVGGAKDKLPRQVIERIRAAALVGLIKEWKPSAILHRRGTAFGVAAGDTRCASGALSPWRWDMNGRTRPDPSPSEVRRGTSRRRHALPRAASGSPSR